MWEDLIQKAKDGGLDAIDTYVFWDVHEPSPGNVPSWISTQALLLLTLLFAASNLNNYMF